MVCLNELGVGGTAGCVWGKVGVGGRSVVRIPEDEAAAMNDDDEALEPIIAAVLGGLAYLARSRSFRDRLILGTGCICTLGCCV